MKPEEALKNIGDWISEETRKRKYDKITVIELSDSLITLKSLIEKQVAKKPERLSYEPLIKHGWEYECPECSKAIGLNSVGFDFTDEDPFCPSCGQKINWEESP